MKTVTALVLTTALTTLPAVRAGAQEVRGSVDVQVGGGYSTNPFLLRGDNTGATGSAFTELSVTPQLVVLDERSEATLLARYRRSDYLRRYDAAEAYGVEARGRRQLTQRLSGTADIAFDSSIIGQGGYGVVGVVNPNPGTDLGTPDIAVIGLNQRQYSLVSALGLNWRATERDTFSADARVARITYDNNGNNNGALFPLTSSTTKGGTLGYTRALSSRMSIGAQVLGSWTEFGRPGFSGSSYQPQGTLSYRLNSRYHFTLAAGAVLISSTTDRGTAKTTGLSGNFYGCRQDTRATACVRLYSDSQATGLGDISRRYGGSADYSYRVRENDVLRATVDYSQIKATSSVIQLPDTAFFGVTGAYERKISQRLFGGASIGYRQATGDTLGRPNDVTFRFFLRTRLGDPR